MHPVERAPLRVFNTLGRELQQFAPLETGRAGVYTCGPTVYAREIEVSSTLV